MTTTQCNSSPSEANGTAPNAKGRDVLRPRMTRKPTLAELRLDLARKREGTPAPSPTRRPRPSLAELRARFGKTEEANSCAGDQSAVESELKTVGQARPNRAALRAMARECREGLQAAEYTRTQLQESTAEWLGEVPWNLAMTLTFDDERGVSLDTAATLYGKFLPKLREVVLRKGARNKMIQMAPIVEDSREQLRHAGITMDGREGTHIHVLLRVRGDDPHKYKEAIARAWRATNRRCGNPKVCCPNSDQWYLSIRDTPTREKLTGYFLKHQGADTLGLLVQYLHLD